MAQWGVKSKAKKNPAMGTWQESRPGRRAVTAEAVAKRAYEKWLARGGKHGNDQRDWFEAERELRAESARNTN